MINSIVTENSEELSSDVERFKTASENYSQFMNKYDRPIGSWNESSMKVLQSQGAQVLANKAESLERQLQYYIECEKEQIAPSNEIQVLWRILQTEKWTFPKDLFSHISNNDVIEIYNLDFTQYFANSTFMSHCSYDLSDLFAYSWPELFERDPKYTGRIIEQAQEILAAPELKTYKYNIEPHFGREIFSDQKRVLQITMKCIAPLFDQSGSICSVVSTFEPKQISH